MPKENTVSPYHNSFTKSLLDYMGSALSLIIFSPLILIIALIIKAGNHGPVFFKQSRTGKDGKAFTLIKFRIMRAGAESEQKKYKNLNQADGPVFKIIDDPRFTKFGKLLSRSGLDELPQFINVLRGEMAIVGPRPLPVNEALKLSETQKVRELIKPGITSSWVVNGSHKLSFSKWMALDKMYVENGSLTGDIKIIYGTCLLIAGLFVRKSVKLFKYLL